MSIAPILIFTVAVIIVAGVLSIFIVVRKRKSTMEFSRTDFEYASLAEGVEIPLLEAYSGLKTLAPVTFARNNLNPKLILFSDHFEYQVLFRKRASYSDIASMRSFRSQFYNKLSFKFHDNGLFFTAVFGNEETLQAILTFLAEKGIRPDEKSRT